MGKTSLNEDDISKALSGIKCLTVTSYGFLQRRAAFFGAENITPSAIICPKDADDVRRIVRYLNEKALSFTVRSGGHDVHGRSMIDGTVCIDMRDINSVDVASDKQSARIGGGVLMSKLCSSLAQDGLLTPIGSVSTIGYFGWASLGGYGTGITHWGLGVDQIIGAEVVDQAGEIKIADAPMLKAIKGSGGNVGIVTSLTIKVYPCKLMLTDSIIIDSATIGVAQTFKQAMINIQKLQKDGSIPKETELFPVVTNHPDFGRFVMINVFWTSDDHARGRKTMQTIREAMPTAVISSNVVATQAQDYLAMMDAFYATTYWGRPETASFYELSSRALDIIGKHLEIMPGHAGTAFGIHPLFGESPSIVDKSLAESSCFPVEARRQHLMVECLGLATEPEAGIESSKWATAMRNELEEGGEASDEMYISLVGRDHTENLDKIYGKNLGIVKELKATFDPHGIFRHAVPRLL